LKNDLRGFCRHDKKDKIEKFCGILFRSSQTILMEVARIFLDGIIKIYSAPNDGEGRMK